MGPPRSLPCPSSLAQARTHAHLSLDCLNGSVAPRHRTITSATGCHCLRALCLYHICVIDLGTSSNLRNLTFLAEFSFIVIHYVRRKGDDILGDESACRLFASSLPTSRGARARPPLAPRTAAGAASLASSRVSLKRTPPALARVSVSSSKGTSCVLPITLEVLVENRFPFHPQMGRNNPYPVTGIYPGKQPCTLRKCFCYILYAMLFMVVENI